jgi:hypothetical protein
MNREVLCGAGRGDVGHPMAAGLAGAATGEIADVSVEVSVAVSAWVEQVGRFLGVVQAALEQSSPTEDATAEVRAVVGQLPALIRQCRAQVPTPEMIQTWVQTLAETRAHHAQRPAGIAAPATAFGVRTRALGSDLDEH